MVKTEVKKVFRTSVPSALLVTISPLLFNFRPIFWNFVVLLYKDRCCSYLAGNSRDTFHFFRLTGISVLCNKINKVTVQGLCCWQHHQMMSWCPSNFRQDSWDNMSACRCSAWDSGSLSSAHQPAYQLKEQEHEREGMEVHSLMHSQCHWYHCCCVKCCWWWHRDWSCGRVTSSTLLHSSGSFHSLFLPPI